MKNSGRIVGYLFIIYLILSISSNNKSFGQTMSNISSEKIIQEILVGERKIHDVELNYDYILGTGFVLTNFDWGYEGGKEYYSGNEFKLSSDSNKPIPFEMHVAFDGEKISRYDEAAGYHPDKTLFKGGLWGRICPFKPDHFVYPRPTSLLGYDISPGRRTFGEILRDAPTISFREQVEKIDGHSCYVIEACGIRDQNFLFDIRAWIDFERNFRPLRIEQYYGFGGKNSWKVLARVIDRVELEQINNVWFPINGQICSFLIKKISPPEGMTEEELSKFSLDKIYQIANITTRMQKAGAIKVKVYKNTVRINQGIEPNKFNLVFPNGTKIYDDYLQMGYTVGEPSDNTDKESLNDLAILKSKNKTDSSMEDLNDIPKIEKNGIQNGSLDKALEKPKFTEESKDSNKKSNETLYHKNFFNRYLIFGFGIIITTVLYLLILRRVKS